MKTKINFIRICRALPALVICLSSIQGQTLDEQLLGAGFEPVVNCDRRVLPGDLDKRIQFLWMDSTHIIHWRISHDLGAVWGDPVLFSDPREQRIDPFAACNTRSADNPRHMYFGWFTEISSDETQVPTGDYFRRSLRETEVDNAARMTSPGADRPWLAANNASLYLSFHVGQTAYVKRAAIPSGENLVDWSGSEIPVFTPDSNTTLTPNFPIAAHRDSAGSERAFLMARQYLTGGCFGGGLRDNSIRIRRSLNQGVDWQDNVTINVEGADGFVAGRDSRMTAEHISRDPSISVKRAYAFYVRNEAAPYPGGGGKRSVLYCRASVNGGDSWNGEQAVFRFSGPLPANGFAAVPVNCSGNTDGFYRIGRVWSSVDDNGNVYVAWMDSRYGKYDATKDYWHVFCSRSTNQGESWSTPIRVSGTTDPLASASIGGYGNPFQNGNHIPPGDFLTCDADVDRLYVAWPDSRANQGPGNENVPTRVYFRRIQF